MNTFFLLPNIFSTFFGFDSYVCSLVRFVRSFVCLLHRSFIVYIGGCCCRTVSYLVYWCGEIVCRSHCISGNVRHTHIWSWWRYVVNIDVHIIQCCVCAFFCLLSSFRLTETKQLNANEIFFHLNDARACTSSEHVNKWPYDFNGKLQGWERCR